MEDKKEETKKEESKKTTAKKETTNKKESKEATAKSETAKKVDNKQKTTNNKTKQTQAKSRKGVIAIGIIALIIVLIIGIGYPVTLNIRKESSLKEIDNMFVAIKSGDEETIKKYFNEENSPNDENDEEGTKIIKIMLSNLKYEVISTDVSLNENIVKVNVTNKNLNEVFSNYMKKALSLAFSKAFNRTTEEEMNEQMETYLEEQYNSEDVEAVTTEITITMKRESGKWKIEINEEELINAILPEYESIINAIK